MKRTNVFDELARQRKEIEYYKEQANKWEKRYYDLLKRFKELESKLNQFLNANTPPSKLPPQFKTKGFQFFAGILLPLGKTR